MVTISGSLLSAAGPAPSLAGTGSQLALAGQSPAGEYAVEAGHAASFSPPHARYCGSSASWLAMSEPIAASSASPETRLTPLDPPSLPSVDGFCSLAGEPEPGCCCFVTGMP